MRGRFFIAVLAIPFLCSQTVFADIIHVPADEPTIQDGIDAALEGDTVVVADGTYTGLGNKNLDFKGKAITVISENGPESCIIDCENDGRGFAFKSGEGGDSIVSGFTITNGKTGYPDPAGSGIYCGVSSSPTIENCIISNCLREWPGRGGGIFCENSSSPMIRDCVISGNEATGVGAGIWSFHASPTIANCTISDNLASMGAGIYSENSSPTITECTIRNNSAERNGGGLSCSASSPIITQSVFSGNFANSSSGGGIYLSDSSAEITSCTISGNSAGEDGGGVYLGNSQATVTNCIITANSAGQTGGGIHCAGSIASPNITNCTISKNTANVDGGGMAIYYSSPIVTNSIFWGDTPNEIYQDTNANPIVTYCDVQGGYPGVDNFHGDPLFVDRENDDYHLEVRSPCIYSGTASGAPDADFEGNPRPQGHAYDVGAYELTGYDQSRPILDSFAADTIEARVPFEVVFTCEAHDPDGMIASYTIDYADGSELEGNSTGVFTHTYTSVGMGYATCTVTDNSGLMVNSKSLRIRRIGEIYVPNDYLTIQAAIDAALDGDSVVVADGTYTGEGNKNLDFQGKAITVRSENGPETCIIDCEGDGRGFNFHSGEGENSMVSGFTIKNGRMYRAGGISCEDSSPMIANCIITNNLADNANSGGIGIYNSSPIITGCRIIDNTSDMWGGGIGCFDSSPTITNCIISGNESKTWWGGGMVAYNSNPAIKNCIFSENSAYRQGGAIYCNNSSPTITNCIISGNSADEGGGLHSAYSAFPVITNSILWSNSPDAISVYSADLSASHSLVQGGWIGEGNIDLNPAFVDFSNGNYHLKDYSPCIGGGTSVGAPDTDMEGNPRPNPPGSNPDMGAYENIRGIRADPPLDVFPIEVSNKWNYEGIKQGNPYTVEWKVVRLDQTTFPVNTYVFEIRTDGNLQAGEWYQKTPSEIRLWSSGGYEFSAGLLAAWNPMQVGDHRESSANVIGYSGVSVSLTVDVLGKGPLALAFETLEAYELSYQLRIWGPGGEITDTFRRWLVPYFGVVKEQRAYLVVELTSFAIGGGTITQETDADGDGLEDYRELLIIGTNWQNSDTEGDGMPDGWEVNYGLNPLVNDANQDADGDGFSNFKEYKRRTDPRDPSSYPSRAMPWLILLLGDDE